MSKVCHVPVSFDRSFRSATVLCKRSMSAFWFSIILWNSLRRFSTWSDPSAEVSCPVRYPCRTSRHSPDGAVSEAEVGTVLVAASCVAMSTKMQSAMQTIFWFIFLQIMKHNFYRTPVTMNGLISCPFIALFFPQNSMCLIIFITICPRTMFFFLFQEIGAYEHNDIRTDGKK